MSGKRWFYLEDERAHGPHTESELRRWLRHGELGADARVWHDGASAWLPLGECLGAPASTPWRKHWHEGPPHPVRRYLARLVDIGFFGLLGMAALSVLLYAIFPGVGQQLNEGLATTPGRALDLLLTVLLSSLLQAVPLGLTGSTLGKWLFGIQVLDCDGHPIGVSRALQREARVWLQGLALGIPVVSLVALGLAYRDLVHRGRTRWDVALGLTVWHRKFLFSHRIAAALGLLSVFALAWVRYA